MLLTIKQFLLRKVTTIVTTLAVVLLTYGNVCLAVEFGDLDDVTMQVIGPDEIPSDVIQNIHLPEFSQSGINTISPSLTAGDTSSRNLPNPAGEMSSVEPIPFDPAMPFDPALRIDTTSGDPILTIDPALDPGTTVDWGTQAPPMHPERLPVDAKTLLPDGSP